MTTEQQLKAANYAFAECNIESGPNDRQLFKAGFIAGLKSRICEICFTDSWQPCPESFPEAIKDPTTGGYMICGYCQQQSKIKSLEAKITALEKELEEWDNTVKSFMS